MLQKSILKGLEKPDLLKDETLADIFYASAQKFPDKTALIFGDNQLTYHELDNWSNALANQLRSLGIGQGKSVGVWYPRSLELHAAILAIVKAGAAYIPVDSEMPVERVKTILEEAGASACFSKNTLNSECRVLDIQPFDKKETERTDFKGSPDDRAYVLYTSGSTGKPKGIPISQRQICHLVRSEQFIIGIKDTDKVYQGFSVSFDMWCEETWISYLAGATLFVADNATAKAIDELSDVLRKNNITVLHAVPSLLAVMEEDIPSLRLINAGGEACTPQVLAKWALEGRTFYNSYGPTETTVTSSMISLKKGDKITIGTPLPNYNYAIVDADLHILPCGEPGELIITGPGVGAGYINLPELTASKFTAKPAALSELPGDMIYRTGDTAVIQPDGTVDFQGRIDDQIKLRGFRIELGEIESRLAQLANVLAAATVVKKDADDQEQLVGYVLIKDKKDFDEHELRASLTKVLAPYMVPGIIIRLDEMPRLPSGKINRKALPLPASFEKKNAQIPHEKINQDASVGEKIVKILEQIFPNKKVDLTMDFFTDLGGHSLLAAGFVSRLRKEGGVKNASLKDIYLHRPLSELAPVWEAGEKIKKSESLPFNPIPAYRFIICWAGQSIALLLLLGLFAAQVFFPYLGYYYVQGETGSHAYAIIASLCLFCFVPPFLTVLSIVSKWLVIGRMKEGDYPLWGTYYFRWWFVNAMQRLIPIQFLNGTPLYNFYLRMNGVKVAKDAQLSAFTIGAEDLVSIGSDASISSKVVLNNAFVEKGMLKLRKITIGNHAYIGSSAVIAGGAVIEDWGELKDLSYLQPGKTIKTREVWQGSPAKCIETKTEAELPQPLEVSDAARFKYKTAYSILLILFPFAILIPLLPVIYALSELDNAADDYDFRYLIFTPLLALAYTLLFALQTVVITNWLQKGIKPGTYPVHSTFYVRKWLADQFMELSLMVMHPVYATVYIAGYFRALGAKVGKETEISTANNVTHPLLEIGEGAFVADAVTLGEADVRAQRLILDVTTIGNKSFIGNSALIPQGYHLPSDMLIGVLSTPPSKDQLEKNKAHDWFGSPAIAMPKRQESESFDASLTFKPSKKIYFARAVVELIRILIPETVMLCTSLLFIVFVHDILVGDPWWKFALLFPLYYLFFMGIPCFLVVVLLKWVLIGVYKPMQKPMWSLHVWLSEAITAIYEALAVPFLLEYLKGTPWLPIILRLLGVKTGKRVWMYTTDITEYDMVTIGDDAELNEDAGPQTHLFEDRVMKVGTVKIGARAVIGSHSIILYDSEIGDDVSLEALSLIMKGEKLSAGTNWGGSPVRNT